MSNNFFVHESSHVDDNVSIGDNTKIWHFSHIQNDSNVGKNCIVGQNVYIGSYVIIGNNVKIQNNVSIYTGVIVEDDVFLGPSTVFTNVINPRSFIERKDQYKKTIIGRGSSIGANVTIICGNNIGQYSFIGAGSVVTKHISPYSLYYGVPAKQKGWVCRCGNKLGRMRKRKYYCYSCKNMYKVENKIMREL